jgi:RNA polymerase sigma-70 factor, ECF subfamily
MSDKDKEILNQLAAGGQTARSAFDVLVKMHSRRLYLSVKRILGNHEDAHDVVQNTFLKAWTNHQGFKGQSALFTWLYRIAVNESLNLLKVRNRFNFSDLYLETDSYDASEPAVNESQPDWEKIYARFEQAIEMLPQKQRLVFSMKYFDEVTFEEMSELLQTSSGALKASYHHAVKKIQKYLLTD